MRDPRNDPVIGRRLAMVRYARNHSKAEAAQQFACCWNTIQAAVRRVEEYERSGDIHVLQNKPRGQAGRTPPEVEEQVIAIYRESFEPPRPQGRLYAAAKVARLLAKRTGVALSRKTAWLILRRRGVWRAGSGQQTAVRRFERGRANELWQIDLIEKEPTAIGEVYAVPIIDDYSRYLLALQFFLTKEAGNVLYTLYTAMAENGTPAEILCDRGGQFVAAPGAEMTKFAEVTQALGIKLSPTSRAETKGKEERVNQFIERDFLDEVRWEVSSLADLNKRGESWRQEYDQRHVHETTNCIPQERYRKGIQIDPQLLRELFAQEERRKVSREATVRYRKHYFRVPEEYIGTNVWVANFFDQHVEIYSGDKTIGVFDL